MIKKDSNSGFSLLEVIIAFAILVMVLVQFYQSYSTGLNSIGQAAKYSLALQRAQSQLARVGRELSFLSIPVKGTYKDGMHWEMHIYNLSPLNPKLKLQASRVTVVLTWLRARKTKSLKLESDVLHAIE